MKFLFGFLLLVFSFFPLAQCNIELGIPAEFKIVMTTDSSMAFQNDEDAVFVFLISEVDNDYDIKYEADSTLKEMKLYDYYDVKGSGTKEINGREHYLIRTVLNDPSLNENNYGNLAFVQVCGYIYSFTFMTANKNHKLHDATFERILSKTDYVD